MFEIIWVAMAAKMLMALPALYKSKTKSPSFTQSPWLTVGTGKLRLLHEEYRNHVSPILPCAWAMSRETQNVCSYESLLSSKGGVSPQHYK